MWDQKFTSTGWVLLHVINSMQATIPMRCHLKHSEIIDVVVILWGASRETVLYGK